MADEETPAADAPVYESAPEATPEVLTGADTETAAEPAPEPPGEQAPVAKPETTLTEEGPAAEQSQAVPEGVHSTGAEEMQGVPEVIVTEPDDEAKGFGAREKTHGEEEKLGEYEEDDVMKAMDSLDALVKSSSMQIAKERSKMRVPDLSSTIMLDDRKDKYAARAKDVLGEVIDIRRGSLGADAGDRRTARYMNTYKLDSDKPFNNEQVYKILEAVMTEALLDLKYEPEKCCKQAKWASNTIKAKVKQLEFERYKIISLVSIGEKHDQDVLCTCRFLWDADRDNYSCYTLENSYIFGIALCFGLYYE